MRAQRTICWVLLALLTASSLAALEIAIVKPDPGIPLFGQVEAELQIYPLDAEVDRVEFFLDGQFVEMKRQRPFSFIVDVGQENRRHEFLFVAYDTEGKSESASFKSTRIHTDMEVEVELQQLYVTVEDSDGQYPRLQRGDFTIRDDGKTQSIVTFEQGDVPFTAVLAVDASDSMQGEPLRLAFDGARTFVRGMRPLDEAKLLVYSDRILHETPFTGFADVLSVGLGGVRARGGTALNDYLYMAMGRLETRQGRRVVVLLSDGIDVHSALDMEQVLRAVGVSQAVIYWIRLVSDPKLETRGHVSFWRSETEHRDQLRQLGEAVEDSGGRLVTIRSIEEIPAAFQTILRELRGQYVLGYYPDTKGDGSWHKVDVRLGPSGFKLRTRGGYFDMPDRAPSGTGR